MSNNVKRWLVLAARILIAIVAPLIICAVKFDVFTKVENFSAFSIICLALVGIVAVKGMITGTLDCVPNKYAYIGKMIQFPLVMLVSIGLIFGIQHCSDQLIYVLSLVLIFNLISMPLTVYYNHLLYEIYGDDVIKHLEAGVLDGLNNWTRNKASKEK